MSEEAGHHGCESCGNAEGLARARRGPAAGIPSHPAVGLMDNRVTEQANQGPGWSKHVGGRPRMVLDLRLGEDLGKTQNTHREPAAALGVSIDTVERRRLSAQLAAGTRRQRRAQQQAEVQVQVRPKRATRAKGARQAPARHAAGPAGALPSVGEESGQSRE